MCLRGCHPHARRLRRARPLADSAADTAAANLDQAGIAYPDCLITQWTLRHADAAVFATGLRATDRHGLSAVQRCGTQTPMNVHTGHTHPNLLGVGDRRECPGRARAHTRKLVTHDARRIAGDDIGQTSCHRLLPARVVSGRQHDASSRTHRDAHAAAAAGFFKLHLCPGAGRSQESPGTIPIRSQLSLQFFAELLAGLLDTLQPAENCPAEQRPPRYCPIRCPPSLIWIGLIQGTWLQLPE